MNYSSLINRSPCPDGVRMVGSWFSTPCTEVKKTLDSVHIWFIALLFTRFRCPSSGSLPFKPPSFTPPNHPCPLPPSLFTPPGQVTPVPTTKFPLIPSFSLFRLAQVQNWSRRNILCGRILPFPNVGFHCLETRLLYCRLLYRRLHRSVLPYSV